VAAGNDHDLEEVAECLPVVVQQVVVREVRLLAEDEERLDPDTLERRRLRCHFPVRGHDRRLAVPVAVEIVLVPDEVRAELFLDELTRCP
jgi:hypothetical protein